MSLVCGAFGVDHAEAELHRVRLDKVELSAVGHSIHDQWSHLTVQRSAFTEDTSNSVEIELMR